MADVVGERQSAAPAHKRGAELDERLGEAGLRVTAPRRVIPAVVPDQLHSHPATVTRASRQLPARFVDDHAEVFHRGRRPTRTAA